MHEIELKPSLRLGLLLAGMAALAVTAVALSALPVAAVLLFGLGSIGIAAWSWRRARDVPRLGIMSDGRLQEINGQGDWADVEVLGDSFVSPALIVLRYRDAAGRARGLTLLPDSAEADALRRLRVSLRWARRTRSDTSFPGAG